MTTRTIDASTFRHTLGHYPTGVCAITSSEPDGMPIGMVVGTFTAVSLEPLLVGFLPDRRSRTWPRIQANGHFCVNVLASDQIDSCRRIASSEPDKFSSIAFGASTRQVPIIEGAIAYIECVTYSVTEAGDHDFVIGEVLDLKVIRDAAPLLFLRGKYGGFSDLA